MNRPGESPKPKNAEFLRRMEAKRLAKECPYALDMRGKAPGKIREVDYKGRTFFVDDISHTLLKRGLERTGGVFTVGLYEAIINGPHTHRAKGAQAGAAADEAKGAGEKKVSGPAVMEFGYFHRRKERRLNFTADVRIISGDMDFLAATRNLSPSGLRVNLTTPFGFEVGARVAVDLGGLGITGLGTVGYEVLRLTTSGNAVDLMLRLAEGDDERIQAAIDEFIEQQRLRYRLDVGDALHTTSAFFYERLYSDNDPQLPLYFSDAGGGALALDAVIASRHNEPLLERFRHDGRYDFSGFCLPWRLEHLRKGGAMTLLVAALPEGGICTWDDVELAPDVWRGALAAAAELPGAAVFYLRGTPIPPAAVEKALARQGELVDKGAVIVPDSRERLERLALLVRAADITAEALTLFRGAAAAPLPAGWCGGERRSLGSDAATQSVTPWQQPNPTIAHVVYRGRRCEERYLARTAATVSIDGQRHRGHTVDISRGGMRLECPGDVSVERDERVMVSLTSLQEKRPDFELRRIPYRVANLAKDENNSVLMLERQIEGIRDPLRAFFDELLETNRSKLKIDRADIESAALARLYGTVGTTELATLPLFLRLDDEGRAYVEYCVTNRPPNALTEFFRTEQGGYDFSALARDAGAALRELRFVKMAVQEVEPFSEIEVDQAVLAIFQQSQFKARHFKQTLDSIVGVAEAIDLTAQVVRAAKHG